MSAPVELMRSLEDELKRLRKWRDTVLWLAVNAPPASWERGIQKMAEARAAGRGSPECNLIACVQYSMPQREPTRDELQELLEALARLDFCSETQADLLAMAMKNPPWYLRSFKKLASDFFEDEPI